MRRRRPGQFRQTKMCDLLKELLNSLHNDLFIHAFFDDQLPTVVEDVAAKGGLIRR